MNLQTGAITPWDSLTEEQRTSGDWIKLPPHDSDGHCNARQRTVFDDLRYRDDSRDRVEALEKEFRREFDALGRPR